MMDVDTVVRDFYLRRNAELEDALRELLSAVSVKHGDTQDAERFLDAQNKAQRLLTR